MECPEEKNTNDSEKSDSSSIDEFCTSSAIKNSLKDLPDVLSFIQRLQECIVRQRALIHRLYDKLKESGSARKGLKNADTQTDVNDWPSTEEIGTGNIVNDIKEAAENAVQQTGFVYESTSGMYYDYNTGYYYNAELGLYYDGQNGTYYYFDESSKSFQFHSQVSIEPEPSDAVECSVGRKEKEKIYDDSKKRKKVDILETHKEIPKKIKKEKEEGECSESSSSESENEIGEIECCSKPVPAAGQVKNKIRIDEKDCKKETNIAQNSELDNEVANAWPPCLRIIVKETGLEGLVVGSLFIITCTGGTLGREGDHAVVIPDINISKHHARVTFSESDGSYQIVDLGSRNGTFVDGRRISVALRESEAVPLVHGTEVRVGSTVLLCHQHPGRETCSHCEPGCAQARDTSSTELSDKDHETREARHRSELRRLRKRFGLDKLTVKETQPSLAPGYQDRAEERRQTVGSLDHNAKTETASVHQSIQSNNKGFKMLSKMGWAKGQSLGKESTKGITEPVLVVQRPDKAGLGADLAAATVPAADPRAKRKTEIWKKAQKRFQELDD